MSLTIRNPHSVLAVFETRPQDVLQLSLPGGGQAGDAWKRCYELAREHKVRVVNAPGRSASGKPTGGGREGAVEALVKERPSLSVEELFANAATRKKGKGLWLALDSLTDPHNVGAIFRTAGFFGVQGIVLTEERSAPLTSTVYDVASGGMEYVPFVVQTNLQRAFEKAKEAGLWILGSSEHAGDELNSIECDRPWLLVLGNEERGMRRLTEDSCDLLCRIPTAGKVTSLNVSVAAGIMVSRLAG